jgi:hypothetical protein
MGTQLSTKHPAVKMELGSWVESFVNEKKHPLCTAFQTDWEAGWRAQF